MKLYYYFFIIDLKIQNKNTEAEREEVTQS